MKILTILLPAMMIMSVTFAQKPGQQGATPMATSSTPKVDGIMNKDGKVWYIKKLTGTMPLEQGVVANVDGTIKLNGKTMTLHNGDWINFQGQLVGLNQRSSIVDGMVTRKEDGMWIWSVLKKPFALNNGTFAMPDKTIKGKDGKYTNMQDNEFFDLDGNSTIMKKRGM